LRKKLQTTIELYINFPDCQEPFSTFVVAAIENATRNVNCPALKDRASNFDGTSKDRRVLPSDLANSASISSTGDSRRYYSLRFIADVFGGIYVPIMQSAALVTSPRANT